MSLSLLARGRRQRLAGAALAVTAAGLAGVATLAPAADAATGWSLPASAGIITAAPTPTGSEALLWADGVATITSTGSGVLVLHTRADLCEGAPTIRVAVDGITKGTTTVTTPASDAYAEIAIGTAVSAGTHSVRVRFLDDHRTATCDRNVHLGWVSWRPTGTPAPTPTQKATPTPTPTSSSSVNPFLANAPYADPTYPSVAAAAALRRSDPSAAAALDRISANGASLWVGDWYSTAQVETTVRSYARAAEKAGSTGYVTVYAIPGRDCGAYSAGGLTPATYPGWIDAVARGLAGTSTAVILEPDALAQLGACEGQGDRVGMIRTAAAQLTAAGATVYIDAGHSAWIPAEAMAQRLRDVGVSGVRGFSINVSNYQTDADSQAYGEQLSSLLGGAHYVVDTSRNGRGPAGSEWCNPAGRGLGVPPAASQTGHLDANLWIKRVGESDGACNGGPAAGTFWTERAVDLGRNASW